MSPGVNVGITVPPSLTPTAPHLMPRIIWPSLERRGNAQANGWQPADSETFPISLFIQERRKRGEAATHLPMFKEHVTGAVDRVFIVDTYLLCAGVLAEEEALSWFPDSFEGRDVRIMCGGLKVDRNQRQFEAMLTDRAAAINARRSGSGEPAVSMQIKFTHDPSRYPFVHDRFAIVDDELWHFGATVGGFHHGVNAATRGWNAMTVGALNFFAEVWRQPAQSGSVARTACGQSIR